jgi:DNA-binding response OmpR family regulator
MVIDAPAILLVEDEPFLARVTKDSLQQQGYAVTHTADGKKAYSLFLNHSFAICIVDVMLPQTDGFTLVRQIRACQSNVPVLFLTARADTADVKQGYESGGNDYLKKPFSLEELFLRVNELLRRGQALPMQNQAPVAIGRYVFEPLKQTLHYELASVPTKLSHRETQLLLMLCRYKNTLLERKHVLIALWGDDSFFNTRTMDVFITRLRKHLKQDATVEILNIRGLGYKLIC